MRSPITAAAAVAVAAVAFSSADAQTPSPSPTPVPPATSPPPPPKPPKPPKPKTYWQRHGCDKPTLKRTWRHRLRRGYRYHAYNGNFVARPVGKHAVRRLKALQRCARTKNLRLQRRFNWRKVRKEYRWYRYIDFITPYGKWAIPAYIVACESGGSWSAYNPSGASGPYQLLGWGAPMPANTVWAMAQHHIIASRLWAGGDGASNWVCA